MLGNQTVQITANVDGKQQAHAYDFAYAANPSCTQQEFYRGKPRCMWQPGAAAHLRRSAAPHKYALAPYTVVVVGEHMVRDVLSGFNGNVLAYGSSGAGKSHTIMGGLEDWRELGSKVGCYRHAQAALPGSPVQMPASPVWIPPSFGCLPANVLTAATECSPLTAAPDIVFAQAGLMPRMCHDIFAALRALNGQSSSAASSPTAEPPSRPSSAGSCRSEGSSCCAGQLAGGAGATAASWSAAVSAVQIYDGGITDLLKPGVRVAVGTDGTLYCKGQKDYSVSRPVQSGAPPSCVVHAAVA